MNEAEMEKARKARNAYQKEWKARNAEKVKEWGRQWRSNNPEKVREYNMRYWAKRAEREAEEAREAQQDGAESN